MRGQGVGSHRVAARRPHQAAGDPKAACRPPLGPSQGAVSEPEDTIRPSNLTPGVSYGRIRGTVLARNRLHISPHLCYTLSGSRSRASQKGLAQAAPSQFRLRAQEPAVRRLSFPGPAGILG